MGKYKFDFRKLYSLIICCLCFMLMFFSDNISEYVMLTIKNELIPMSKKDNNVQEVLLHELIPSTGIKQSLDDEQDYINNINGSDAEVMYLAEQYYINLEGTFSSTEEALVDVSEEGQEGDYVNEEGASVTTEVDVSTEEIMPASAIPVSSAVTYSLEQLSDFEFLVSNCYLVDSSTSVNPDELNAQNLLSMDMTVDLSGEDYKVLIYHTHGSETFADSIPGVTEDTVIGVGDELTKLLESYGIKVYHDRNVYDMIDGELDRSYAYDLSGDAVDEILAEYPSIEVVIDLHRDGVREDLHLVTDINGLPTAQIMFVNGVSRLNVNGDIDYLYNPNKISNLAFSLQMYLEGKATYGDLMRRIYIRGYCFNLDKMPRAALIEVGAQTNTVQEAKNAMIPLADIIYKVLTGSE